MLSLTFQPSSRILLPSFPSQRPSILHSRSPGLHFDGSSSSSPSLRSSPSTPNPHASRNYIYDPTPIVPFTPHATNPYPLPFSSTRQDLQAWSSTCRRTRDAALPLLSQFVKITSLCHLELLFRGENEERRSSSSSFPRPLLRRSMLRYTALR